MLRKLATWSRKLPRSGFTAVPAEAARADGAGESPGDGAGACGGRPQVVSFAADDVRGLDASLLGGNLTLIRDPQLAAGSAWVFSMGQEEMRPAVRLTRDGVLEVRHDHGFSAYAGQSEPVHSVVILPATLLGDVSLSLKLGEVWVIGSGVETECGPTGSGRPITTGTCSVHCGLGDVCLIDAFGPTTVITTHVGDCSVLARDGCELPDGGSSVTFDPFMGDLKAAVHARVPLDAVTWSGSTADQVRPESIVNGANATHLGVATPSSALHISGKPSSFGDCRVVRFA